VAPPGVHSPAAPGGLPEASLAFVAALFVDNAGRERLPAGEALVGESEYALSYAVTEVPPAAEVRRVGFMAGVEEAIARQLAGTPDSARRVAVAFPPPRSEAPTYQSPGEDACPHEIDVSLDMAGLAPGAAAALGALPVVAAGAAPGAVPPETQRSGRAALKPARLTVAGLGLVLAVALVSDFARFLGFGPVAEPKPRGTDDETPRRADEQNGGR
jgi:hypothetical protein